VLHHTELVHHVVTPDDVDIGFLRVLLVFDEAIVGAVTEAVGIDRHQLAAIRHVVNDTVLDKRR
jgi:hypothetical protein